MRIVIALLFVLITLQISLFIYVVMDNKTSKLERDEISTKIESINDVLDSWELID